MEPSAPDRRAIIAAALEQALVSQKRREGVDIAALVEDVERALRQLDGDDDGLTPEELNASNDD